MKGSGPAWLHSASAAGTAARSLKYRTFWQGQERPDPRIAMWQRTGPARASGQGGGSRGACRDPKSCENIAPYPVQTTDRLGSETRPRAHEEHNSGSVRRILFPLQELRRGRPVWPPCQATRAHRTFGLARYADDRGNRAAAIPTVWQEDDPAKTAHRPFGEWRAAPRSPPERAVRRPGRDRCES